MEAPRVYEIRVKGHLETNWADWFDGLEIIHEATGDTLLRGTLIDQPALFGNLARIQGLGLTLLSINSRDEPSGP